MHTPILLISCDFTYKSIARLEEVTKYWYICGKCDENMGRNTSISLGSYFEEFVREIVNAGRYNNASEVIRAGLRLLEQEENKAIALRKSLQEGLDSGSAEDYDPEEHLARLKATRNA